eukprot:jgi/Chrpa1/6826/Chrysochromulina_OHIO_Genome00009111-RA
MAASPPERWMSWQSPSLATAAQPLLGQSPEQQRIMVAGLRGCIDQLQAKLLEQREALKSERNSMRRTIEQQQRELTAANRTNAEFNEELSQLMDEHLAAKATIDRFNSLPPDYKNLRKIEKLTAEVAALQARLDEAHKAASAAATSHEELRRAEQVAANAEHKKLRKELRSEHQTVSRLYQEGKVMMSELSELRPMREELARWRPAFAMRNTTWKAEVKGLEAEVTAMMEFMAVAAAENRTTRNLYAGECHLAEREVSALESLLASTQAALSDSQSECAQYHFENQGMRAEIQRLQSELNVANGQISDQRTHIDEMTLLLDQAAKAATEKNKSSIMQKWTGAAASGKLLEKNTELRSEMERLQNELNAATAQLAEKSETIEKMSLMQAEAAAAATEAAAAFARLQGTNGELQSANQRLQTELNAVTGQLAEKRTKLEAMTERLLQMAQTQAETAASIVRMQAEQAASVATVTAASAKLQDKNEELQSEKQQLQRELDATIGQLAEQRAIAEAMSQMHAEAMAAAAEAEAALARLEDRYTDAPPPATKEDAKLEATARVQALATKFQSAVRGLFARMERDRRLMTVSVKVDESGQTSLNSLFGGIDLSEPTPRAPEATETPKRIVDAPVMVADGPDLPDLPQFVAISLDIEESSHTFIEVNALSAPEALVAVAIDIEESCHASFEINALPEGLVSIELPVRPSSRASMRLDTVSVPDALVSHVSVDYLVRPSSRASVRLETLPDVDVDAEESIQAPSEIDAFPQATGGAVCDDAGLKDSLAEGSAWAAAKRRARLRILHYVTRLQARSRGMKARAERDRELGLLNIQIAHALVELNLDVDESGNVSMIASWFANLGDRSTRERIRNEPAGWPAAKRWAKLRVIKALTWVQAHARGMKGRARAQAQRDRQLISATTPAANGRPKTPAEVLVEGVIAASVLAVTEPWGMTAERPKTPGEFVAEGAIAASILAVTEPWGMTAERPKTPGEFVAEGAIAASILAVTEPRGMTVERPKTPGEFVAEGAIAASILAVTEHRGMTAERPKTPGEFVAEGAIAASILAVTEPWGMTAERPKTPGEFVAEGAIAASILAVTEPWGMTAERPKTPGEKMVEDVITGVLAHASE